MTFQAFEASTEGSRPVELYRIALGTTVYTYTSSEAAVTYVSEQYLPIAIKRGRVGNDKESRSNLLEVTVPADNPFAQLYVSSVPGQRALITIRRIQLSDGATPEGFILFQGFVQSVGFSDDGKLAKIAVLPPAAACSRPIPRFTYQSLCNHVLYDERCKILRSAFKFTATVSAVNGSVVTVPGASGYGDGWFTSGYMEALGGLDARLVLSHTGNNLTLLLPFPGTLVGQTVDIYAGCDHTLAICKSKFNNVLNHGGFAFVPKRNPFNSGIL